MYKTQPLRFLFIVIISSICNMYLQATKIHLDSISSNSLYKLCLLGIQSLAFDVNGCNEATITLFDKLYDPAYKLGIKYDAASKGNGKLSIYQHDRTNFTWTEKGEIIVSGCQNLLQYQINWKPRVLTVQGRNIAPQENGSASHETPLTDTSRGIRITTEIEEFAYVTVFSASLPRRWTFHMVDKAELRPITLTDIFSSSVPRIICPMRVCDYSKDSTTLTCEIKYFDLVPKCDDKSVYLPSEWCKDDTCSELKITIMGCFSIDDSCNSCKVINFSREVRQACQRDKSDKGIRIAEIESCERFNQLWPAYLIIVKTAELYNTTFPTTSSHYNNKSTTDDNVITDDLTTMADTSTVKTSFDSVSDITRGAKEITTDITTSSTEIKTNIDTLGNSKTSDKESTIGIIGGTVGGIVVIAVAVVIVFFVKRRSRQNDRQNSNIKNNDGETNQTEHGQRSHDNYALLNPRQDSHKYGVIGIQSSKPSEQMPYEYIDSDFTNFEQHLPKTTEPNLYLENQNPPYMELGKVLSNDKQTNETNNYIKLDPTETGFDRSNEGHDRNIDTTNYNVLDPNETGFNSSNLNSGYAVKSDNFCVLEPEETGFNRSKINADTNSMAKPATHDAFYPNIGSDLNVNANDYGVLDPEETGFDRSKNDSKPTEYFILDPNETGPNLSHDNAGSDHKATDYVILDANETGFDRSNENKALVVGDVLLNQTEEPCSVEGKDKTTLKENPTNNRPCVYELAKPINIHDESLIDMPTTNGVGNQHENQDHLYSHAHDHVYDTAKQGKHSHHIDETCDHIIKDGV